MKYIFIVPAAVRDSSNFLNEKQYQVFWKKFRHYDRLGEQVTFRNFSDNKVRGFTINLNFNLPNKN